MLALGGLRASGAEALDAISLESGGELIAADIAPALPVELEGQLVQRVFEGDQQGIAGASLLRLEVGPIWPMKPAMRSALVMMENPSGPALGPPVGAVPRLAFMRQALEQ